MSLSSVVLPLHLKAQHHIMKRNLVLFWTSKIRSQKSSSSLAVLSSAAYVKHLFFFFCLIWQLRLYWANYCPLQVVLESTLTFICIYCIEASNRTKIHV